MKTDRLLDRFIAIFVAVVMATFAYFGWVISEMGAHWAHLYWIGLGAWGFYVLWHVEEHIKKCRDQEFRDLVNDWVRRGSPDAPLELDR